MSGTRQVPQCKAVIFFIFLLLLEFSSNALAAPSCTEPNLTANVTTDTSFAGEVYIDRSISIHQGATLTFEAGTQVTMCNADAAIIVGKLFDGGGGLVAIGTEQDPIVFNALDPAVKWNRLFFNWEILPNSTLQYVILNDGGGNDPDLDPDPTRNNAALYIGFYIDNAAAVPVIDHVSINNSGSNGLLVEQNVENDPIAASISNITISNSAGAAVVIDAGAVGGLSGNNLFTGNSPDRIIVGGSAMRIHATWRDHGVPYELTDGVSVRTTTLTTEPVIWTLEPGVTLLVHPGKNLVVGSNSDASLHAVGTASEPIIITRLDPGEDYWGQLILDSDTNHSLEHVEITRGGEHTDPADTYGMIRKTRDGAVNMVNVRMEHSASSAMEVRDGDVYIRDSVIANNTRVGMYICCGAGASIRNSEINNNLTGGILNYWHNSNCIDAVGNYWGDTDGPADDDDRSDACGAGGTNDGFGDSVTAGVIYRPWLASTGGAVSNRSRVSVDPPFVIADSVETAEITVTLRDLSGAPLAGKNVEIQSTLGDVTQPGQASDANGQVTAYISSGAEGFATVTATNLTDNDQVAGVGGVSFWQGPGDTGGLIDPNGAPYAKPELLVDKPPFVTGFPMEFSLPMQNTRPYPLDVEVTYSVTGLNIGASFSPVFTTQRNLSPGEKWTAPGVYVPDTTGHQCVQAEVVFDDGLVMRAGGSTLFQKNTNQNPCEGLNVKNLVPTKGGLLGVLKHMVKATKEASKANKCIVDQVTFGAEVTPRAANPDPGYDQVFVPPVLTPPLVIAGGEITPELADVMNELADIGGRISALITANGVTRQRLQWAGQAGDQAAINLQYEAFRRYSLWEGQKLLELATALDVSLDELAIAGIEDVLMTVDDQLAYLEMLKTTGFEQDTIDYLLTSGWSPDEVDRRLEQEIAEYEATDFATISFTDAMRLVRDKAVARGNELVARYGDTVSRAVGVDTHSLDPIVWNFMVGHTEDTTKTVKLKVKPLNLPVNWAYELSERNIALDPGRTRDVTLRVYPEAESLGGETIALAVEGYIGDALIGGISFDYYVPRLFTSFNCTQGDAILGPGVTYFDKELAREEAAGDLSTTGDVVLESGATVTYVATNSIALSPGFRAMAGSEFSAEIAAVSCTTGP